MSGAISSSFLHIRPAADAIYTRSLHDALPISHFQCSRCPRKTRAESRTTDHSHHRNSPGLPTGSRLSPVRRSGRRSEEHTSELQSPCKLVCRLLLEKKKQTHTRKM